MLSHVGRGRGSPLLALLGISVALIMLVLLRIAPALAQTSSAAHGTANVAVVELFGSRIDGVTDQDGGIPVLLPTTMLLQTPDFTASSAKNGSYTLEIDGEEPCNGANVCLYAVFSAQRGGKRYGSPVMLSRGIVGAFADIQCGAACSPASIDWIEHGVLYTIEANPAVEYHPHTPMNALRSLFVSAAKQAIDAGPRSSFIHCADHPGELLWDVQVRGASCAAADSSWSLSSEPKEVKVGVHLYRYTSSTGWSCLEERVNGPAQDGEVQLWDCRRGAAEALLSDTPYVKSRSL
jgi:hypothetical protein